MPERQRAGAERIPQTVGRTWYAAALSILAIGFLVWHLAEDPFGGAYPPWITLSCSLGFLLAALLMTTPLGELALQGRDPIDVSRLVAVLIVPLFVVILVVGLLAGPLTNRGINVEGLLVWGAFGGSVLVLARLLFIAISTHRRRGQASPRGGWEGGHRE